MKKSLILIILLLLVMSIFIMGQECSINLPDKLEVSVETGQITEQETTVSQAAEQQDTQQTTQQARSRINSKAETVFLIITIASFVIAVISGILGFRKDKENAAGKILFGIFISLFLIFLILYVLALINVI
ncbi:MAG: hypothetical protein ACYCXK_07710 [Candidatus Humimicrobiaceae bacterium]